MDRVDFAELEKIGQSLAETGRFADPYKIPTGPTAHGAPFFPYLMSWIFSTFGYGAGARAVVVLAAVAATALSLALLPVLAVRIGIPGQVGAGAGLFAALIPFRALSELVWESPYASCGWVAAAIVSVDWVRRPSPGSSLLCGLVWGLQFWIAPQLAMPFAALLLLSPWLIGWPRGLRLAPVVAVTAACVIAPWIWRGYRDLGAVFFVRNNLPLELAVSNFPGAAPDFNTNCMEAPPGSYCLQRHPFLSETEAAVVGRMGETAYQQYRLREVLGYLRADPGAFVRRTALRVVQLWFPPSGPAKRGAIGLITLLAIWGLWKVNLHVPRFGRMLAGFLLAFPLPYYFLNINTRYLAPLWWLIVLCSAYGVWVLLPARFRVGADQASPAALDV